MTSVTVIEILILMTGIHTEGGDQDKPKVAAVYDEWTWQNSL